MLRSASGLTAGQVGALLHPGFRSGGVVYGPPVNTGTSATTAVAADTIYGLPFLVPNRIAIAGLQIVVAAAVSGVSGKLAICRGAASGGGLGALVAECNATVDMGASSNTVLQSGFAAIPTLEVGWHWLLSKFNGAAQPYTLNLSTLGISGLAQFFGATALTPFARISAAPTYSRVSLAQTYASAFPADLSAATFDTSTPGAPIMGVITA